MWLGPIHPTNPYNSTGHNPVKPIKVSMTGAVQTVLFDNSYPYALQSNAPQTTIDTVLYTSAQSTVLSLIHQIEELAQNAEWQRAGLFIQWREDAINDGEDGWYIIKSAEISEDLVFSGYAEPKIDVELRIRQNSNVGVYVDAKAVPNDYSLSGVALAAYPQGLGATIYPASTWTYTGKDAASILVVEGNAQVLKGQLTTPNSTMTLGRCSCFDSTTNDSTTVEVFWKDHRFLNGFVKFDNDLVRYTVNLGTAGEPLIEVASASAWVTLGNIQINTGTAPVQAVSIQTISPEELIWVEERYGSGAYFRVINRLRRGSRIIESTVVAAGNTSFNGAGIIKITNIPAGITGITNSPDTTAVVGTGGTTIVPGFSFLTKPPNATAFASNAIDSGMVIPAGTIIRYGVIAGLQDAGQWVAYAAPSSPTSPVAITQGTAGATSYTYAVYGVNAFGTWSPVTNFAALTTGNATLTGTNFNKLTWVAAAGDVSYVVVLTATAGAHALGVLATGIIGTTYNDQAMTSLTTTVTPQTQAKTYATNLSSYNRTRVKQRLLVAG